MNTSKAQKLISEYWLDIAKAELDPENLEVIEKIRKLNQLSFTIKKMSTAHIGLLINAVCSCLDSDECYVNIGVWNGYSFFSGILGNDIIAVANDSFQVYTGTVGFTGESDRLGRNFGNTAEIFRTEFDRICTQKQKYYIEDCWEFIGKYGERNLPKVGFYFYDGDHSYESQLNGLRLMYPYLAQECIVMIDDTNDEKVKAANETFFKDHEEFEKIADLSTPCNGWPTWWNGIMLYARKKQR
jgi:hypothetical protein